MTPQDAAAKLQALIDREMGKKHTHSFVLSVQSQEGSIDFTGAAGVADPAADTRMMPGTPYFIASVTKMYTAAVIMRLHQQGKLDLDEPAATYLPAALLDGIHQYRGTDYSRAIKVYHLISHTSGLFDYFEDRPPNGTSLMDALKQGQDREWDVQGVVEMARGKPPKFAPGANDGKKAHYSDTNYQLLGAIIEAVTGQSLAENYRRMIFEPLGLAHTYLFDHAAPRAEQPPASIYFKDRAMSIPRAMTSFWADGGIVSTAGESLRVLRAFFDGELFERRWLDRMMARWNRVFFPIDYGYGIMRFKLPRIMSPFYPPPELIGHSGSSGSFAFFAPEEKVYAAGTLNQVDAPGRPFTVMIKAIRALS